MTWPLALRLGEQVPVGQGGDVWVHWWTFHWVEQTLLDGQSPYFTDLLFYPTGVSLTSHNIAWLNIALWEFFKLFGNAEAAYGLMYIAIFAFNGCAMYLFARDWFAARTPAFLAGLVLAFWPHLMSQTGHPNMIILGGIPLAFLYLRRTLATGKLRPALWAGFWVAFTGVGRWQMLIIASFALALFTIYELWQQQRYRQWRSYLLLAITGAVALALMAPLATPLVVDQLNRENPEEIFVEDDEDGTNLLAYFAPNINLLVWSGTAEVIPFQLRFRKDRVDYLGWVVILLAVIGVWRNRRHALFWLGMVGLYMLFGVGSELRISYFSFPQIPMFYDLVKDNPLIRLVRNPHRFNAVLAIPMAMLVGYGIVALWRQPFFAKRTALLAVGASTLILLEYSLFPYPMQPVTVPTWYQGLAEREPEEFGVLDVPMHVRGHDKNYMRQQITHGKPIVEGHISRPTGEAFAFLDSSPFLHTLRVENKMDPFLDNVTEQLRVLAEANVRYLVMHKMLATPKQLEEWQRWLEFAPMHEDEQLLVYRTAPDPAVDFAAAQPLTEALSLLRLDATEGPIGQGSTLTVNVAWATMAAPGEPYERCLDLTNAAGDVVASQCGPLSDAHPTEMWRAGDVVRASYAFPLDPFLPSDTYALELSVEGAESGDMGSRVVRDFELSTIARNFDAPSPQVTVDAQWGERLALLGYDVEAAAGESGGEITLRLHWQALQRMENSYKIFVHVFDVQSGEQVAGYDSVPLGWAYPTVFWEQGEYVTDVAVLPLPQPLVELEPGAYELYVGVYDELTGERLAGEVDGEALPNERLLLTDFP